VVKLFQQPTQLNASAQPDKSREETHVFALKDSRKIHKTKPNVSQSVMPPEVKNSSLVLQANADVKKELSDKLPCSHKTTAVSNAQTTEVPLSAIRELINATVLEEEPPSMSEAHTVLVNANVPTLLRDKLLLLLHSIARTAQHSWLLIQVTQPTACAQPVNPRMLTEFANAQMIKSKMVLIADAHNSWPRVETNASAQLVKAKTEMEFASAQMIKSRVVLSATVQLVNSKEVINASAQMTKSRTDLNVIAQPVKSKVETNASAQQARSRMDLNAIARPVKLRTVPNAIAQPVKSRMVINALALMDLSKTEVHVTAQEDNSRTAKVTVNVMAKMNTKPEDSLHLNADHAHNIKPLTELLTQLSATALLVKPREVMNASAQLDKRKTQEMDLNVFQSVTQWEAKNLTSHKKNVSAKNLHTDKLLCSQSHSIVSHAQQDRLLNSWEVVLKPISLSAKEYSQHHQFTPINGIWKVFQVVPMLISRDAFMIQVVQDAKEFVMFTQITKPVKEVEISINLHSIQNLIVDLDHWVLLHLIDSSIKWTWTITSQ